MAESVVELHNAGGVLSASLRTPEGRVVRIHSARDPVAEADRFVEAALGATPGGAPPVVILVGPGLGYAIEAIVQRAADARIIALEPFPELARAMLERREWGPWLDSTRLTLLVGPDYVGVAEVARRLDEKVVASASVIEHPVMQREFPAEMEQARLAAVQIIRGARLNAEARRMFAGRYLLNTLANMPAIAVEGDVASLTDRFTGVPAIVVAAGPSLDAALPYLQTLQERALIVAVDTTLRPLQVAGIRPHLVVAVDPSELNARHLLGIEDTEGSWLVSEGSIDPRVFPEFAGRAFTFKVSDHQPWPWLRTQGVDRGTLRAWGSVLTTAFDLACVAGCDPIVFVGADLAYTGGVHYCRGTMNENASSYEDTFETRAAGFAAALEVNGRPTCEALDIRGEPTVSTPQFVQFRDWLVQRAAEARPRRILNATGAGILHGEDIHQTILGELLREDTLKGGERLRAHLAAIWSAGAEERLARRRQLEEALGRADVRDVPVGAWCEFAAGGISAGQILERLDDTWRTPPAIVSQPADVTWMPGGAARFAVEFRGGPPPEIEWQESRDGCAWSSIAGVTAAFHRFEIGAEHRAWRFRARLTNRNGTAVSASAGVTLPPVVGVVHDFNGDGRPDVFWRNDATGSHVIWFMDGVVRTGLGVLVPVPDPQLRLVGAGDCHGRGGVDILWQVRGAGIGLWHVESASGAKEYGQVDAVPDLPWVVTGAGDFNGDGKTDLVLRHDESGAIDVWLMDGRTRTAVISIDAEPDLQWAIAAIADFNGDGKPDIVWRHTTTGANRVWLMDGVARVETIMLDAEPDLAWVVVGAGDFNGDGKPDILWRHAASGEMVVWYMDGTTRAGLGTIEAAAETSWEIAPDAVTRTAVY